MDVSLVIPIYKAESFLGQSLEEIDAFLSQITGERWELILVIDASPDHSLKICREFASSSRSYSVKIIPNETNLGKGGSVQQGMLAATGRYRIFNDCDLAYPMNEVMKLLASLKEGTNVAIASRACKNSRYVFCPENFRYLYTRHLASRLLNFLIKCFFLPRYKDTQAGLKGFTAQTAQFLFSQLRLSGFSFDLEILYLASKASLTIREVPVHFYANRVTTVNFTAECLRMFRDIILIYYWKARGRYDFSLLTHSHEEISHSRG